MNVVIALGAEVTPIPPLKLRAVTVPELFNALQLAGGNTGQSGGRIYVRREKNPNFPSGPLMGAAYFITTYIHYTFQTTDKPPRDDSVWYFNSTIQEEPKACRFWQLAPLDHPTPVPWLTDCLPTESNCSRS